MNHLGVTMQHGPKAIKPPGIPGLIPAAEMFGRPLPGLMASPADIPFEERFALAWQRLLSQFSEEERAQLKHMLRVEVPGTTES